MRTETSSLLALHAFLAVLSGQANASTDQRAQCTSSSGAQNSTCIGGSDRSAVLLQRDTQITQMSVRDGIGISGVCPYHQNSGTDCGFDGITEQECEARGCCWDPTSLGMWCYPRGPVQVVQGSGMCPHHANSGTDCGFEGITEQECEARDCCWDATSPSMWCYPRGPVQNSGMCPYHANSGDDCGFDGITQQQCEDRGCCWDPTSTSMLCYPRGPAVGNANTVTVRPAATRFLSWNVYYANDLRGRAGKVADGIIEVAAEIVSLQEMWHEWDAILQQLNRRMPNSWSFARGGQTEKVWDGDILFRSDLWMLESSGVRAYTDRGISWAALKRKSDGVGVIAAGTHPWCCTNGEPILRAVQYELLTLMKQLRMEYPGYPAAVMGDFNANYYGHAMSLMREGRRSAFNREWSILPYIFKDSYAIDGHNPDQSTGYGVKIDFVYFEQAPLHMGEVVGSKVWGDCKKAGSDHCGVSGDIILSNMHVGGDGGLPTTTAPTAIATTSKLAASSCAAFAHWPAIVDGVSCGACTALVLTADYGGKCDDYCRSFGHVCVAASEEENDNCNVKYHAQCDEEILGTSDMLCTCKYEGDTETDKFEPTEKGDGQLCRGPGGSDDTKDEYYEVHDVATLADCKRLCLASSDMCTGIEWGEHLGRCEVWHSPIGSSKSLTGFLCLQHTSVNA